MDINKVMKQKDVLEKRIFNMLKKFELEHDICITEVHVWGNEDDTTIIENITLRVEFKEDTDRMLVNKDGS